MDFEKYKKFCTTQLQIAREDWLKTFNKLYEHDFDRNGAQKLIWVSSTLAENLNANLLLFFCFYNEISYDTLRKLYNIINHGDNNCNRNVLLLAFKNLFNLLFENSLGEDERDREKKDRELLSRNFTYPVYNFAVYLTLDNFNYVRYTENVLKYKYVNQEKKTLIYRDKCAEYYDKLDEIKSLMDLNIEKTLLYLDTITEFPRWYNEMTCYYSDFNIKFEPYTIKLDNFTARCFFPIYSSIKYKAIFD